MVAKSKKAHKKKKISKHVLMAREGKAAVEEGKAGDVVETPPTNTSSASAGGKRKKKKNRHVKDPSEATFYLEDWNESRKGKSGWKFSKNTQSWLIRHMYEADKIPKGVFSLLLEYLAGIEGKATKSWIRSEASRRALRYKNYEKKEESQSDIKDENVSEEQAKETTEDEREDEARWQKLSDHDKRKEYKRARKILETVTD